MTVSCGRFSDGIWVQFKAEMELVFSKASGFSYKMKVLLQIETMEFVPKFVSGKSLGLTINVMAESVTDSVAKCFLV